VRAAAGENGRLVVEADEPTELLHRLTGWALDHGTTLPGLTVDRPSLEDIYLSLTAVHDTAAPVDAPAPRRRIGRRG
jgi:ABC-2 type transport system ATP-binding protein